MDHCRSKERLCPPSITMCAVCPHFYPSRKAPAIDSKEDPLVSNEPTVSKGWYKGDDPLPDIFDPDYIEPWVCTLGLTRLTPPPYGVNIKAVFDHFACAQSAHP